MSGSNLSSRIFMSLKTQSDETTRALGFFFVFF